MATVTYTVIDGEVISENRGGVERDNVPDPLGSMAAILDNTQAITDTFSYWPYGEMRTRTGTTVTPFQYVGTLGYYRDSSGRTYVRARIDRTDLTRWQTEDTIGLAGGDRNTYRVSGSAQTVIADPSGLIIPAVGIGLIVGGGGIGFLSGCGLGAVFMLGPINRHPWFEGPDKLAHCTAMCLVNRGCGGIVAWL